MVTEKSAWEYIANWYQERGWVCGICSHINWLLEDGEIEENVADSMKRKLEKRRLLLDHVKNDDYYWPLDREGRLARIDFCLKCAKECE